MLHKAGVQPSEPAYRRGVDYLLRTQAADGSWHVTAHALPIQPPIDSGFPYGRDQWISSWATAYAASAIAYALERSTLKLTHIHHGGSSWRILLA